MLNFKLAGAGERDFEEDLGECRPGMFNERRLCDSGILTVPSVETREDAEEDVVRFDLGLLTDDLLGPFFKSVGSKEFVCDRKKVATRWGIATAFKENGLRCGENASDDQRIYLFLPTSRRKQGSLLSLGKE